MQCLFDVLGGDLVAKGTQQSLCIWLQRFTVANGGHVWHSAFSTEPLQIVIQFLMMSIFLNLNHIILSFHHFSVKRPKLVTVMASFHWRWRAQLARHIFDHDFCPHSWAFDPKFSKSNAHGCATPQVGGGGGGVTDTSFRSSNLTRSEVYWLRNLGLINAW